MDDIQAPELIYLDRFIRNPILATGLGALGSVFTYIILYYALRLPISLMTGIIISAAIPIVIAYPIFSLISTQSRHLRYQYHQLKELDEQKSVLISLLAHDMRSPLAQLKQVLDFVSEEKEYNEKIWNSLPDINQRVSKTLGLLDNLLTWSRGSFHPDAANDEPVDVSNLINDLFEQFYESAQEKQLALCNHVNEQLRLHTRSDFLKLVLRNLLTNAIKFTPEHGHIDIDCSHDGHNLCLTVSDNGIGMDNKTLTKLFNNKLTTAHVGTRGETGSGIGLLLCKQLLYGIGGDIRVESCPGHGSRFHIYLPITS